MKILYLHQYFKTPEEGGAIRSYTIAKGLVDAGHTVIMITSYNEDGVSIKDISGIRVHYLPVKYDNAMGFAQRLLSFAKFYRAAYRQVKMVADVDLVYATSTPLSVGMLARKIKLKLGLPYLFEVRDLWPDAPLEIGPKLPAFIKRQLYKYERRVYDEASHVIALSPAMKSRIRLRSPSAKITIIPNISDIHFFRPSSLWQMKPLQISYFGAVGKVNGLESLVSLAEYCIRLSLPVQFNIYGTGSEKRRLESLASDSGCTNMKFHGHLDKEALNTALQSTAIALISFAEYPILETSSPNKFFDALAAGKMIITNTRGWIADLVDDHKLGFFYDRNHPEAFVRKLTPYLDNRQKVERCQKSARALAESEFAAESLLSRLLTEIKTHDRTILKKLA